MLTDLTLMCLINLNKINKNVSGVYCGKDL